MLHSQICPLTLYLFEELTTKYLSLGVEFSDDIWLTVFLGAGHFCDASQRRRQKVVSATFSGRILRTQCEPGSVLIAAVFLVARKESKSLY